MRRTIFIVHSLVLGVMSASAIFLDKVSIIKAEGSSSLWLLFIICTLAGVAVILISGELKNKTILDVYRMLRSQIA